MVVGRVASTGKSREFALRLVDREGRMRQYKTRIQAFWRRGRGGGAAERLLLASHDVTDLRASEERLVLQAHALEGMTEAIVITLADGTVLTVNRAFCDITGYERDDALGQPEKAFRNALQPEAHYDEILRRGRARRPLVRHPVGAAQEWRGLPRVAQHPGDPRPRRRNHALRHCFLRGRKPRHARRQSSLPSLKN